MSDINISLEADFRITLNSHIQMFGDLENPVLEPIEIGSRFAKYKLIGFNSPKIFVCDFRRRSLKEIRKLEAAYNNSRSVVFDDFLEQFTKPALLCIKQQDDKNIMLELRDPQKGNPRYLLVMSNGIEITTPKCNFIARKTCVTQKEKTALFFIIDMPQKN